MMKKWLYGVLATWRAAKGQVAVRDAVNVSVLAEGGADLEVMTVDVECRTVRCGKCRRRVRPQVALVLAFLLQSPQHSLSYADLNGILGQKRYFDGSKCSRQRVRTLKRDLRKALEGFPFDVMRPESDCIRLVRTDGGELPDSDEADEGENDVCSA